MGDQWAPRYGRSRNDGYSDPYQNYNQHDTGRAEYGRYENYNGHAQYADHHSYGRSGYYDGPPSPRRGHTPPPPPYHDQGRRERPGSGFTFKGVADQRDNYRPSRQEETFSFRAQAGPSAPRFPPEPSRGSSQHMPTRSRRPQDLAARGLYKSGASAPRGGRTRAGNRGRPWRPAPHERDILFRTHRESTPEQLEGMNSDGQARFKDVASDEDNVIDLTGSDGEQDAPKKRQKTAQPAPAEQTAPRWSNAEYLTALPPIQESDVPKKDIVQVIRKSKVDAIQQAAKTNAVKDNADFISFDDVDANDDSNGSDRAGMDISENVISLDSDSSSGSDVELLAKGKAGARTQHVSLGNSATNGLSANDRRRAISSAASVGSPPKPLRGLIMPTDAELAATHGQPSKVNSKKRKHDETSSSPGSITAEWKSTGVNETPWFRAADYNTKDPAWRLHEEIRAFYEHVRPFDYEESIRSGLIQRVQSAVRSAYKVNRARDVQIISFGSFASGLYLPTSDMDLVAVTPGFLNVGTRTFCQSKSKMHNLARHLGNVGIVASGTMSAVVGARVPIIKFADSRTGIKVDISFENDSGLKANRLFDQWKMQYPAMPIIVVIIKQFLAMRNLNEVFQGGLGGFSIICLVVNMLAQMPENQSGSMDTEEHYGELLMRFFDLYGNRFDYYNTGLQMNPPGYFDKSAHYKTFSSQGTRLTIIDPNNPNNDISGGTTHIGDIFQCFSQAYNAIQERLGNIHDGVDVNGSILGCILGGNYAKFERQRMKLKKVHDGEPLTSPPVTPAKKTAPPPGKPQAVKQQHPLPPKPGSKPNNGQAGKFNQNQNQNRKIKPAKPNKR